MGRESSLDLRRIPDSRSGDDKTSSVNIAQRMTIDHRMPIVMDEDL
jgi:hypothetical protein